MNKKLIVVAGLTIASTYAHPATFSADGRSNGMGNIGVATADYLAAPFYNPALVAVYRESDNAAILIPAVAINASDVDNTIDTMDDLQDEIKRLEGGDLSAQVDIDRLLIELDGNAPLAVKAAAGIAVAIPNETISINFYTKGFVDVVVVTDVNIADYTQSFADLLGFGYAEYGVAFAKQYEILGEKFSFGITPKYQQFSTYIERVTVEDFDVSDYDENEKTDSAANLDIGAVWLKDNFRVGASLQNILKQDVNTITVAARSDTYEMSPQLTIAGAYTVQAFTVGLDLELMSQERFKNVDDDTQFVRVGIEGNAFDWLQLRAGYQHDMEDTLDDAITAGIGISPFGVFNIDLAGSYAGENQIGAAANLSFMF